MGTCWNCGKQVTLNKEEVKCDSCGEILNYRCHWCKEWFSVLDETTNQKRKECKVCGFFYCPYCNVCGNNCQTKEWKDIINEILSKEITLEQKSNKIIELIEEIKLNREQKSCFKGVPISYAKSRIKRCIVKMKGFRVKDDEDMNKFIERYNIVMDKPIGEILSVNKSREKGSYGQEFRDVFNFAICRGKLKKLKIMKIIDGEEIELICYKRVEEGDCPYLDMKDLIIKVCENNQCKIKEFPNSQTHCCNPRCNYKKGKNKGQPRKLKLKISTKDICQLNRGNFEKEDA